jgi:energy-coupling factor transporter transmembrane protein EcfT
MPRVFAIIIASSLYRSEFLAQALYFRGFGLPSRTHYRKIAFKRVDLLRSSFWSLILVLILQINSLSFS